MKQESNLHFYRLREKVDRAKRETDEGLSANLNHPTVPATKWDELLRPIRFWIRNSLHLFMHCTHCFAHVAHALVGLVGFHGCCGQVRVFHGHVLVHFHRRWPSSQRWQNLNKPVPKERRPDRTACEKEQAVPYSSMPCGGQGKFEFILEFADFERFLQNRHVLQMQRDAGVSVSGGKNEGHVFFKQGFCKPECLFAA